MESELLRRAVGGETDLDSFLQWLLRLGEGSAPEAVRTLGVGRSDFLVYFLNFVHEEIPRSTLDKFRAPQKNKENRTPYPGSSTEKRQSLSNKPYRCSPVGFERRCDGSPNASTPKTEPKTQKKHSNTSLNSSYCSPVSPLYSNSFDSHEKNTQQQNKCVDIRSPVRLGDFLVTTKNLRRKKLPKPPEKEDESKRGALKRINPTVARKADCGFARAENSFNFQDAFKENNRGEVVAETVSEQRNILAEERTKILTRRNSNEAVTKKLSDVLSKSEIEPKMCFVTNKTVLNCVAEIYVNILNNHMVLNTPREIFFLVSLLLTKTYADDRNLNSSDVRELFENAHNVVYFSVRCLERLSDTLKFYDKATLKMLSENGRISTFSPDLSVKLLEMSKGKADAACDGYDGGSAETVRFNSDTDNRENFPDDPSFHAFRKQRDLFYETLRQWQAQRLRPGFDFANALGDRVRAIFALSSDPANYVHFCRLFEAQMLAGGRGPSQDDEGEEEEAAPAGVAGALGAEKLRLLRRRLVTPGDGGGAAAAAAPDFYRAFAGAAPEGFRAHLADALAARLEREALPDADPDAAGPRAFAERVAPLRAPAAFLGYLEAFPYRARRPCPDRLLPACVELRRRWKSRIDIKAMLEQAKRQRGLIAVVPWAAEYLGELDYVALRTPHYSALCRQLVQVYRNFEGSEGNAALIRFALGRFFDTPQFCEGEFFEFAEKAEEAGESAGESAGDSLDDMELVDDGVLCSFCPLIERTRRLLSSSGGCSWTGGSVAVRHITPVTAAAPSAEDLAKRRLELRLEEAFLGGQPASTRRAIEFVAERVASACVKSARAAALPAALEEAGREGERERCARARAACLRAAAALADERIPACVAGLLPPDALPRARDAAVAVALRSCLERVRRWTEAQVTPALFADARRRPRAAAPTRRRGRGAGDAFPSGFGLLRALQDASCEILDAPAGVDGRRVLGLLAAAAGSVAERADVNEVVAASATAAIVDIAFLLAAHRSDVVADEGVARGFAPALRACSGGGRPFAAVFCPRNVRLMARSADARRSWRAVANLLASAAGERLLDLENFEAQCAAFCDRDEETPRWFGSFLKDFVASCERHGGERLDKFVELLRVLPESRADL